MIYATEITQLLRSNDVPYDKAAAIASHLEARIRQDSTRAVFLRIASIVGTLAALLIVWTGISPYYEVFSQRLRGEAELARANANRQILVAQAHAEREAADQRARAIAIMGEAAKQYPEYRQQEFIGRFAEALKDGKISQIIYVPTEANTKVNVVRCYRLVSDAPAMSMLNRSRDGSGYPARCEPQRGRPAQVLNAGSADRQLRDSGGREYDVGISPSRARANPVDCKAYRHACGFVVSTNGRRGIATETLHELGRETASYFRC
jgi:hypothetical protein